MSQHYQNLVFHDLGLETESIYGKPVLSPHDIDDFQPSEHPLSIKSNSVDIFLESPEYRSAQMLVCDIDSMDMAEQQVTQLINRIKELPDLKGLVISYDDRSQATSLIEALPLQLEFLSLEESYPAQPARYPMLRQLLSYSSSWPELLSVCSVPNLHVLEVGPLSEQFVEGFNQARFTQLRHIGFSDAKSKDSAGFLQQCDMPESIQSLSCFMLQDEQSLKRLSQLAWAKQLTHLTLEGANLTTADNLSKEHFPALKYLRWNSSWHDDSKIPEFLFNLDIPHLHTLNLSHAEIDNDIVRRFLKAPVVKTLRFLCLDFNDITDEKLLKELMTLPCTVSVKHQRTA